MSLTKKELTRVLQYLEKDRIASEDAARYEELCEKQEARRMLKCWGIWSRYSSRCGYKDIFMFQSEAVRTELVFLECEILFIDSCMLDLKNSKDANKKRLFDVGSLYYKGFDVAIGGKDWSEKLTITQTSEVLKISYRAAYTALNALESFIISKKVRIWNAERDRATC